MNWVRLIACAVAAGVLVFALSMLYMDGDPADHAAVFYICCFVVMLALSGFLKSESQADGIDSARVVDSEIVTDALVNNPNFRAAVLRIVENAPAKGSAP